MTRYYDEYEDDVCTCELCVADANEDDDTVIFTGEDGIGYDPEGDYEYEFVYETNQHGNGFEARVYVDIDSDVLSFDIAHVMDGVTSQEDDAVGVILSPPAALALAHAIIKTYSKLPK
jgi:hypothetical protein